MPEKFFTTPIVVITVPQHRTKAVNHQLGRIFLMMMLDGISARCQHLKLDLYTEKLTEQDVWNEEDRACNVVLVAGQANILVHAFDLRIADVASIDVTEEIENTEHTD
jgi:hypothetical protein